ncbi:bifunctional UDP-N-acetylglucosamine diphosphorylase/glucosamine-1-phosphate N-acetyltransferase GlmU [Pseudofrankia inefficax]|uniref:Bifunctional protein GlmU n=1 Tax=Pseudofrankia inefficax (strain DSM 45817 / CECT 9037 / DDB 130130 / EuI1c) TaxID=298654 RepID=E3JCK1_PSEI1|nr:bifunctional UDP-N-acetylglucosamine diphosphorylase/glucosamine-1-phosphate N-acetyltransferase GlmU [Pseudofrankia inefficax]ADP78697.1 UDP-N-acetylglucosamine pyrophosphorylase [Pseudofrankia inefficax]
MTQARLSAAIVLAAGAGTRMRSATPKVLHRVAGRTLLDHVLAAAAPLGAPHSVVVVGHGREAVAASVEGRPGLRTVVQDRQAGTGHAVRVALGVLDGLRPADLVAVLPGDTPLLTSATLAALLRLHAESGAAASVLTALVDDPTGYGRIVRAQATVARPRAQTDAPVSEAQATPGQSQDQATASRATASGSVRAVVEQRDADPATAAIREINAGVYVFTVGALRSALGRLTTDNAQGEEYLTDVIGLLVTDGETVSAHVAPDAAETAGVNDRVQLAAAGAALRDRLARAAMLAGTTIVDPATTWIDADVTFEPDSTVLPNTHLRGATHLAAGSVVGPDTTLTDTTVEADAFVERSTVTRSWIGPGAGVGPYAHLRPGTRLGANGRIGAYVETKAAEIGAGTKVPHLAYVGDATIGERSNIGCSTVFANYDGVHKHRTVIGSDVKIGSDTVLVAPVVVGDGAYTGAGAIIKQDLPPGALGITEGRQRTIEGWVERSRPGTAAALAARRAQETSATKEAPAATEPLTMN